MRTIVVTSNMVPLELAISLPALTPQLQRTLRNPDKAELTVIIVVHVFRISDAVSRTRVRRNTALHFHVDFALFVFTSHRCLFFIYTHFVWRIRLNFQPHPTESASKSSLYYHSLPKGYTLSGTSESEKSLVPHT